MATPIGHGSSQARNWTHDPSHSRDNARPLTCCATRELLGSYLVCLMCYWPKCWVLCPSPVFLLNIVAFIVLICTKGQFFTNTCVTLEQNWVYHENPPTVEVTLCRLDEQPTTKCLKGHRSNQLQISDCHLVVDKKKRGRKQKAPKKRRRKEKKKEWKKKGRKKEGGREGWREKGGGRDLFSATCFAFLLGFCLGVRACVCACACVWFTMALKCSAI